MNTKQLPTKEELELKKLQAETEKLALESKLSEQKLLGKEKPSLWEIIRTLITWLGIIVPVSISVFAYLHQRQVEIDQKKVEAQRQHIEDIKKATELMEKDQDRASGVLQLSLYGEEVIPILLGEVRVARVELKEPWFPKSTFAALSALRHIGIEKLKPTDIDYLRSQGDVAVDVLHIYNENPNEFKEEDINRLVHPERFESLARIVEQLQVITGTNPTWQMEVEKAKRK